MTDKELNELRDRLAESAAVLCALSKNNPTIARINFQDGFDAAIKALKDNYVDKAKVQKLVEALKFYADGESWSCTDKNKNEYTNLEHDKDLGDGDFDITEDVNDSRVSGLRARKAISEFEGEK